MSVVRTFQMGIKDAANSLKNAETRLKIAENNRTTTARELERLRVVLHRIYQYFV